MRCSRDAIVRHRLCLKQVPRGAPRTAAAPGSRGQAGLSRKTALGYRERFRHPSQPHVLRFRAPVPSCCWPRLDAVSDRNETGRKACRHRHPGPRALRDAHISFRSVPGAPVGPAMPRSARFVTPAKAGVHPWLPMLPQPVESRANRLRLPRKPRLGPGSGAGATDGGMQYKANGNRCVNPVGSGAGATNAALARNAVQSERLPI